MHGVSQTSLISGFGVRVPGGAPTARIHPIFVCVVYVTRSACRMKACSVRFGCFAPFADSCSGFPLAPVIKGG
jgi:hypothetical protein